MNESELLGDLPVGPALSLGALRTAEHITYHERAGETRDRMGTALEYLGTGLLATEPEIFVTGRLPDLADVAMDWSPDDRWRFLVELRCSNPFYPFEFAMSGDRAKARNAALREVSRSALRLPMDSGDDVGEAWDKIHQREHAFLRKDALRRKAVDPKSWAVALGVGVTVAGAAVVAAPAIALMMPAASGLSGAAAVSAGLAQLGFGSVASGGLGMVGGMWVLGAGGAAAGTVSAATAQLLAQPGSAHLVGVEVRKLLVTYTLAQEGHLQDTTEVLAKGLDRMSDEVADLVKLEESRNEKGSDRLGELYTLQRTLDFAGDYMAKRYRGTGA